MDWTRRKYRNPENTIKSISEKLWDSLGLFFVVVDLINQHSDELRQIDTHSMLNITWQGDKSLLHHQPGDVWPSNILCIYSVRNRTNTDGSISTQPIGKSRDTEWLSAIDKSSSLIYGRLFHAPRFYFKVVPPLSLLVYNLHEYYSYILQVSPQLCCLLSPEKRAPPAPTCRSKGEDGVPGICSLVDCASAGSSFWYYIYICIAETQ